jgi:predicted kinase
VARPTLIVYCGLPGVGKSAASAYTADHLQANRYRSDRVRKRLFPEPSYIRAETDATYKQLLQHARTDLRSGTDVVLDATFQSAPYRDRAAEVARAVDADCTFVRVVCDVETVRVRMDERTNAVSDAQFEQHLQLRETFDPVEREHVVVDNSGSLETTHQQIDRELFAPVVQRR